jgi:hypothetical protein
MPGTGGMGGIMGGKDMTNDPKAYRVDYSKRRLRAELHAVQLALGRSKRSGNPEGLYVYAKAEPETSTLKGIKDQIEEVIKVVEEQTRNMEAYEKDLKKQMKKLEGLTKALPVAAKGKADAAKGAAAAAEGPAAAKPAAEEPMEEIPMGPPAAKGGPAAPADPGKAAPADPGKAAPADPGKAAPAPAGKAPAGK